MDLCSSIGTLFLTAVRVLYRLTVRQKNGALRLRVSRFYLRVPIPRYCREDPLFVRGNSAFVP